MKIEKIRKELTKLIGWRADFSISAFDPSSREFRVDFTLPNYHAVEGGISLDELSLKSKISKVKILKKVLKLLETEDLPAEFENSKSIILGMKAHSSIYGSMSCKFIFSGEFKNFLVKKLKENPEGKTSNKLLEGLTTASKKFENLNMGRGTMLSERLKGKFEFGEVEASGSYRFSATLRKVGKEKGKLKDGLLSLDSVSKESCLSKDFLMNNIIDFLKRSSPRSEALKKEIEKLEKCELEQRGKGYLDVDQVLLQQLVAFLASLLTGLEGGNKRFVRKVLPVLNSHLGNIPLKKFSLF